MKKIDYDIRASFNEFVSEDSQFIRKIIKDFDIRSALEIPCANGRNLAVIGDAVSHAYFADINSNMVEAVRRKIASTKRDNCEAFVLDMCDLSRVPIYIDAIFIMQQSFQFLTFDSAKAALCSFRKSKCHYIIIDIYDFNCGALDLPKFLVSTSRFVDEMKREWVRYSSIKEKRDNWVRILHEYKSCEDVYYAEVSLRNYSRDELIMLSDEAGLKKVGCYSDYLFSENEGSGRTILILENRDK